MLSMRELKGTLTRRLAHQRARPQSLHLSGSRCLYSLLIFAVSPPEGLAKAPEMKRASTHPGSQRDLCRPTNQFSVPRTVTRELIIKTVWTRTEQCDRKTHRKESDVKFIPFALPG